MKHVLNHRKKVADRRFLTPSERFYEWVTGPFTTGVLVATVVYWLGHIIVAFARGLI